MTPQHHYYAVRLHPTLDQLHDLRRLRTAVEVVLHACHEQAVLRWRGQDVSIAKLLGGTEHPGRTPELEARALVTAPVVARVPDCILRYAVEGYHDRVARVGSIVKYTDIPSLGGVAPLAGEGLISSCLPDGMVIAGVRGVVRADVERLPPWARAVWRRTAGVEEHGGEGLEEAFVTRWAYVEWDWHGGQLRWSVDVQFRWDEVPAWLLDPRWEDRDEMTDERRSVGPLMGW